jgi:hypothetical protein
MRKTYTIRWNNNGVRGFGSIEAAQQYINKVCRVAAPEHEYLIEQEFQRV